MDVYCSKSKTLYEFNGCYYHHCKYNCFIAKGTVDKTRLLKIRKVQEKDKKKRLFLISRGYKVVTIQQCQFINDIKPKCLKFYDNYLPSYYRKNKTALTMNKIITDIIENKLFGVVVVGIHVKDDFNEQFSEYPHFLVPVMSLWEL